MRIGKNTCLVYLALAMMVALLPAKIVTAQGYNEKGNEIPNLEGVWTVTLEEMCLPGGYEAGQGTLEITTQTGGVFVGQSAGGADDFTGAIAGRQVRFSDVDYQDGFIDDMGIFTGTLYGLHRIVGTVFYWDIDAAEGSCNGNFEAVRDPLTAP